MSNGDNTPPRPDDPRSIFHDGSLTDEQKIRLLEDWRLDLLERQRASEENMDSPDRRSAGVIGEQLRLVTSALTELTGGEDGN